MRDVFPRPSPELKRRIALAAAADGVPTTRYCRRVLERWVTEPSAAPATLEGPRQFARVPVADITHRALRVVAAEHGVSMAEIVTRVLESRVPYVVETLTRVVEEGAV